MGRIISHSILEVAFVSKILDQTLPTINAFSIHPFASNRRAAIRKIHVDSSSFLMKSSFISFTIMLYLALTNE